MPRMPNCAVHSAHGAEEPSQSRVGRIYAAACLCKEPGGAGVKTKASRRMRPSLQHVLSMLRGATIYTLFPLLLPVQVSGQQSAGAAAAAAVNSNLGPLNFFLQGFSESVAKPVKGMLPTTIFYTPGISADLPPFIVFCVSCQCCSQLFLEM